MYLDEYKYSECIVECGMYTYLIFLTNISILNVLWNVVCIHI